MLLLMHVCAHVCTGWKVLCAMSEGKLQKARGFSPSALWVSGRGGVELQVLGLPAYSITCGAILWIVY